MVRRSSIQAGAPTPHSCSRHQKPGTEQMMADGAAHLSVDGVTPA